MAPGSSLKKKSNVPKMEPQEWCGSSRYL